MHEPINRDYYSFTSVPELIEYDETDFEEIEEPFENTNEYLKQSEPADERREFE